MMVVPENRKCALEQWVYAVSPYDNPGPSNILPIPTTFLYPCVSLKDLMFVSQDLLGLVCFSICIQVCNRSACRQYVMIRLKSQFDTLLLLVKVEIQIEMRGCMYTVGRGLYQWIFDEGYVI